MADFSAIAGLRMRPDISERVLGHAIQASKAYTTTISTRRV